MQRMQTFDEIKAIAEAQAKIFYAEYAKTVAAAV
jgi:hypothetical protein